jgi:hypothetical protein
MDTIAPAVPASPTELRHRRVRLQLGGAAAAQACAAVQAAIAAWSIPVNPGLAVLLTSDLVINAANAARGETITLGMRCGQHDFRVEIHDPSVTGDTWVAAPTDTERGLLLIAAMATEWGLYRTPAGRAVFYSLALDAPDSAAAAGQGAPRGPATGDGEP